MPIWKYLLGFPVPLQTLGSLYGWLRSAIFFCSRLEGSGKTTTVDQAHMMKMNMELSKIFSVFLLNECSRFCFNFLNTYTCMFFLWISFYGANRDQFFSVSVFQASKRRTKPRFRSVFVKLPPKNNSSWGKKTYSDEIIAKRRHIPAK